MSAVNITNVTVLDNPASFLTPFQFEISYECLTALKDDLEWKLIYVGSAEDETYDQLLESVLVGPVNVGNYRFVLQASLMNTNLTNSVLHHAIAHTLALTLKILFGLQADPPDPSKIREEDIIGVTVLLLTCSYLGQEFIRVGYYVNNDYDDEQLREEPPPKVLIDRVQRNILSDKPRVTKFPINFHPENNENEEQPPPSEPPSETGEDPLALVDREPADRKDS
ncbi:histone chaperone ASF1 [Vigna unguiculata]|uniref:Histone chaperone ASF1 n=1 Tax=Vigna unguiculata TaxID=3917 RepID=A0A4D6NVA7_VIGUN|nr:histone chaperone ASF1 [Vigna unguiculata]